VDYVKSVFSVLLDKCIKEALGDSEEMTSTTLIMQVPALVMKEIDTDVPFILNMIPYEETGWMYKSITNDPSLSQKLSSNPLHFIWPTDSF
jgi:hypothetical protein